MSIHNIQMGQFVQYTKFFMQISQYTNWLIAIHNHVLTLEEVQLLGPLVENYWQLRWHNFALEGEERVSERQG